MKFRVWNYITSEYMNAYIEDLVLLATGNLARVDNQTGGIIYDCLDPTLYHMELGTGMIDATGREIYEGDIVKTTNCDSFGGWEISKVIFEKGEFKCESKGGFPSHFSSFTSIKVIGNLHKNPELL